MAKEPSNIAKQADAIKKNIGAGKPKGGDSNVTINVPRGAGGDPGKKAKGSIRTKGQ